MIRVPRMYFWSSSFTVMKTDMYNGTATRRGMRPLNRYRIPSWRAIWTIRYIGLLRILSGPAYMMVSYG